MARDGGDVGVVVAQPAAGGMSVVAVVRRRCGGGRGARMCAGSVKGQL